MPQERERSAPRRPGALHVLVTGSNTGFGELIAKTLATAGHHVLASMRGLSDRNAEGAAMLRRWAATAGVTLDVVELDVTNQDSVDRAIAAVHDAVGHIDVVINNAGSFAIGFVEAFAIEQIQALFDVNTFGAMRVNRAVLPAMRRRRSGLIVHMSSTAGRILVPGGNPYAATKFALEALAESLNHELAPFGVDVVILEPGYYPTTQFDRRRLPTTDAAVTGEYAAVSPAGRAVRGSVLRRVTRRLKTMIRPRSPGPPDPQEVADAVHRLVEMPAGTRPLRTVVGTVASAGVEELNGAYDACRRKMLASLGMWR
jgi:NAD(P)-dependent dehydrogenase (short-subunit alcohol dehydrogenase family)